MDFSALLRDQDGVVARRQLLDEGLNEAGLARDVSEGYGRRRHRSVTR